MGKKKNEAEQEERNKNSGSPSEPGQEKSIPNAVGASHESGSARDIAESQVNKQLHSKCLNIADRDYFQIVISCKAICRLTGLGLTHINLGNYNFLLFPA